METDAFGRPKRSSPFSSKEVKTDSFGRPINTVSEENATIEELLTLAQAQGGKIGEIANELGGGSRGILSTIGSGLKDSFNNFIELVSVPGQVVAGMISPDFTIAEAIKENKRVSDVIFGSTNIFNKEGDPTTMQKVGDFIVRLPTDILSDPLTWVTFGAHRGVGILGKMGFGSNSQVSLYQKAAAAVGKNIDDGEVLTKALSDHGQDIFGYGRQYEEFIKVGDKIKGIAVHETKEDLLRKGFNKEVLDMMESNVRGLMKQTIDKPFEPDVVKKAISLMVENRPALAKEFIDKGGIKLFGKSILEGQRIGAVAKVIPGMKWVDQATLPFRNSVEALFNPNLKKVDDGSYVRLPEEYINMKSKLQSLGQARNVDYLKNLDDLQQTLDLNKNELDILTNHINTSTLPSDSKLQTAYYRMQGIKDSQIKMLAEAGVPVTVMDNWVGLVTVPNDTRFLKANNMFSQKVGSMQRAGNIKAIPLAEEGVVQQIPEVQRVIKELSENKEFSELTGSISKARTVEDVTTILGKQRDDIVKDLMDKGASITEALTSPAVKQLDELQGLTKALETEGKLVGLKETAKLKDIDEATLDILGDDFDSINYLMDNDKNIYKRVATTAQELKAHGIEGFDENLLTAWTVRGMSNIRQSLGKEFSEGLVRNFGRWADEAPDSWISMSNALVNDEAKALAKGFVRKDGVEMKFHPAIVKSFDEMIGGLGGGDEATKDFLKAFDKIQSYYKSYLTTMFPMFHGRNAISNVLLNYLDLGLKALDPSRHFMAVDMIYKDRKINKLMRAAQGSGDEAIKATEEMNNIMATRMFTDRVGHEWTYGELRKVIRDNNVAFNPNITGAIDVQNDISSLAKHYGIGQTKSQRMIQKANLFNSDQFAGTRGGREVGRAIEEQGRLINFMSNLIDTGDVTHAAARTKQFLFDYQHGLSTFEKNVMRRLIPFYSFTRFNLELQAKVLFSAPGKIASEIKAVQSMGSFLGGEPMTEEEKKLLPPWLANSINLKRRKEDGTYEIISGFGTPIEQPFQALSPRGFLGSISPILKYPIEEFSGYNLFRGKNTSEVINAEDFRGAPQAVKDLIGYVKYEGVTKSGEKYETHVSLRPDVMHRLLSLPFSRFVTTVSSVTDKEISASARILNSITGVKAQSFDEELARQQKEREMLKALESMLKNAGVRGQFNKGYTRKDTDVLEQ